MPRAIISSGHTSSDPGTQANGLTEYDVAKKIARAIVPILRQHGIITLSVPADLDLLKRIDWINKTNYDESNNDVAIEIHINEGGDSGIESWYEGEGDSSSKKLSEILVRTTSEETGLKSHGAKSEYEHEIGSIAFLHDVSSITALVECGFLDNDDDAKFLKEDKNIEKMAIGVAKGVLEYFNVPYRTAPVSPIAKPIPTTPVPPHISPVIPPPTSSPPPTDIPAGYNSSSPTGGFSGGFDQTSGMNNAGMGFGNTGGAGFMSRDDRKKMIEDMYVKILGREPNQNDLNYFLNTGISEQDLLKKMVDSQEHADLVKSRQEVITIKDQMNENKSELVQLRASVDDQKVIIRNLHTLIAQKNEGIAELQQQLSALKSQNVGLSQTLASGDVKNSSHNYKGTFLDKLFKAFSDLFE